jgi:hypothetical protein
LYLREQLDRVVEFVGVRRNGSVRYDEMVGGMLFGVDESVFVDDDDGDGDEALERSAVQIQRLYRGYSVRRGGSEKKVGGAPKGGGDVLGKVGGEGTDEAMEKSAVQIQRLYRGYHVRGGKKTKSGGGGGGGGGGKKGVVRGGSDVEGMSETERSAVQIQRLYRGYSVRRRPAAAPTKREKREMGVFRKEYESALGKLLEGGGLYRVLEEMRSVSGGGESWKAERVGVALGGELPVGVVAGCVRVADKGRGGGRGGCVVAS